MSDSNQPPETSGSGEELPREISVNPDALPPSNIERGERGERRTADAPRRAVFTPPIDIYEVEEGLVLYADLPGVSTDSLTLEVQDNKLTLFGRVEEKVDPQAEALHREYETGDYLRSFILSDEVDHERITAGLNNGVLKVVLPRIERAPARQIPIQSD